MKRATAEIAVGPEISVIIPAYNEAQGIMPTLTALGAEPRLQEAEIIVVDDGSTDDTAACVMEFPRVRLVRHSKNNGYGTAIKSGIRASTGQHIAWFDADGQHRVADLIAVLDTLITQRLDYCVGVRDARSHAVRSRRIGKFILKQTVRLAAGQHIADFNSGLRAFRREVIFPYLHLMPKGFGASTTMTLLMIERGYSGADVPIVVHERIGKSSVKQLRDGIRTLMIILRIFLLFKPLVFFGGIGVVLITLGSIYGFAEAISVRQGFPVFAAVIIILGVQAFFFGLLSDQVSQLRRERFE
ncbi:MAG: glycosyltransferase family 2 protein [Chloroflexi bacterium]|nr:glycosyltransferase family 2 protein [Chloroflexota bacterium]